MSDLGLTFFKNINITPKGIDANIFQNSLKTIDANAKEAIKTKNAIESTIANLDMDASEDEWKRNYANNISKEIENEALYGDYSRSLKTATVLASKVAKDPTLLGRVKDNQAHKANDAKLDELSKQGKISSDTADYFKELNQYYHKDNYDKEGNYLGSTTWTPDRTPVDDVDLTEFMQKVSQFASFNRTNNSGKPIFVNANGEQLTSWEPGCQILAETKYGRESLTIDDLKKAFDAVKNGTPGAGKALDQQFEVALWASDKAEKEGDKTSERYKRVYMANGIKCQTTEDFVNKAMNPFYIAKSYTNTMSEINYQNPTGFNFGNSQDMPDGLDTDANSTSGESIEFDVTPIIKDSIGKYYDGIDKLKELFPHSKNLPEFNRILNTGDYDEIKNAALKLRGYYLKDCMKKGITPDPKYDALNDVLRVMSDNWSVAKNVLRNTNKEALEYSTAYDTNTLNSQINSKNKYIQKRNEHINELFNPKNGYTENGKLAYEFKDEDSKQAFIELLKNKGITDYKKYGVKDINLKGNDCIEFDSNCPIIDKIATVADELTGVGDAINIFGTKAYLIGFNKDNTIKNREHFGGKGHMVFLFDRLSNNNKLVNNTLASAYNSTQEDIRKNVNNKISTTTTVIDIPRVSKLKYQLETGQISNDDYYKAYKQANEEELNFALNGDFTQNTVYAAQDFKNNIYGRLKKVEDSATKNQIRDRINAAKQQGKNVKVSYQAGDVGGYGTRIEVSPGVDSDKDITGITEVYFIPGKVSNRSAKELANNTNNRAREIYLINSNINGDIRLRNNVVIKFKNGEPYARTYRKGKPVDYKMTREDAITQIARDKDIENAVNKAQELVIKYKYNGGNINTDIVKSIIKQFDEKVIDSDMRRWGLNPAQPNYQNIRNNYYETIVKAIESAYLNY